jgi:hypothetical protein
MIPPDPYRTGIDFTGKTTFKHLGNLSRFSNDYTTVRLSAANKVVKSGGVRTKTSIKHDLRMIS